MTKTEGGENITQDVAFYYEAVPPKKLETFFIKEPREQEDPKNDASQ